jgi:hypothetical protein
MEEPTTNRMEIPPRRRGPPSKLETTTPLPEGITKSIDLPAPTLKGIERPPCCGVSMHPRRTGESAGKLYATCGHCGRSLVITQLGGDRLHVRVSR